MDWNERNRKLSFFNFYRRYLYKASSTINDTLNPKLDQPLDFNAYERTAIGCVLTQTMTKLNIVNCGVYLTSKNAVQTLLPLNEEKVPMEVRFKNHILDKLYDERTLQPLRECFKAISNAKLASDIDILRRAIEICFTEFQTLGRFDRFAKFILAENREARDEYKLLKSFSANAQQLAALNDQLSTCRVNGQQSIAKLDDEIFHLTAECDDFKTKHAMENRMVAIWEETRQEQCEAIFEHELRELEKRKTMNEEKIDGEMLVINELRSFYQMKCEKLESSIASWSRRYEMEKKFLDEQIQIALDNIEDVRSKYTLIQKWHEEREAFIENYRLEQKQLEARRKHEARQCQAAIQIQAWWRGTMVRKQLGPYRPKKKGKKNKNEKKK